MEGSYVITLLGHDYTFKQNEWSTPKDPHTIREVQNVLITRAERYVEGENHKVEM